MSVRPISPLLPDPTWPVTKPFWAAAAVGEFRLPRCSSCHLHQWYPRVLCRSCLSSDFSWEPVDPAGAVYTYTIVHRAFIDGAEAAVPFSVVHLHFDAAPGVTFITNLADDRQIDRLAIGARSTLIFMDVGGGLHMPYAVLS